MGLEIEMRRMDGGGSEAGGQKFRITERIFKTKEGEIVPEGDPRAHFLFKNKGSKIPIELARDLGLVEPEKEEPVKQSSSSTKKAPKASDKKRKSPPKNKGKGGK